MLKIFAKYNTDEKAAIFCSRDQVKSILESLNNQYGGSWLLVDECFTGGEILKFNDGQVYLGFEADKPDSYRYSNAIKKFRV